MPDISEHIPVEILGEWKQDLLRAREANGSPYFHPNFDLDSELRDKFDACPYPMYMIFKAYFGRGGRPFIKESRRDDQQDKKHPTYMRDILDINDLGEVSSWIKKLHCDDLRDNVKKLLEAYYYHFFENRDHPSKTNYLMEPFKYLTTGAAAPTPMLQKVDELTVRMAGDARAMGSPLQDPGAHARGYVPGGDTWGTLLTGLLKDEKKNLKTTYYDTDKLVKGLIDDIFTGQYANLIEKKSEGKHLRDEARKRIKDKILPAINQSFGQIADVLDEFIDDKKEPGRVLEAAQAHAAVVYPDAADADDQETAKFKPYYYLQVYLGVPLTVLTEFKLLCVLIELWFQEIEKQKTPRI